MKVLLNVQFCDFMGYCTSVHLFILKLVYYRSEYVIFIKKFVAAKGPLFVKHFI